MPNLPEWYTEENAKGSDPEILEKILDLGRDDTVATEAVEDPCTPPEALARVLDSGRNDWVSRSAAQNRNTPPEALGRVLDSGRDD